MTRLEHIVAVAAMALGLALGAALSPLARLWFARPITRARMWWRRRGWRRPTREAVTATWEAARAAAEPPQVIGDSQGIRRSDGTVERILGLAPPRPDGTGGGFSGAAWIDLLHPADHADTLVHAAAPAGELVNRYRTSGGYYLTLFWRWEAAPEADGPNVRRIWVSEVTCAVTDARLDRWAAHQRGERWTPPPGSITPPPVRLEACSG